MTPPRGVDGAGRWHRASAAVLTGALLLVAPVVSTSAPAVAQTAAEESPYAAPESPLLGHPPADWPAPDTPPGSAYVLVDAATGQTLAAHDADERRAVASTVKVLTALSVVARSDLDEEVTVGDEVLGVPGSGVGLEPGDTWTVRQLLDAVVSRSGNEAAEALAVHVGGDTERFLGMMMADAAALGLDVPPLVSVSGLDDANQLSASDLATLARVALAEPELRPFFGRRAVQLPSVGLVESRNQLLSFYPEATGVKTGFTDLAGNSLIGSAMRDGRELIAVVLDAGEDPARFEAAAALLDLGFDAYRPTTLEATLAFATAGGEVALEVPPRPVVTPADEQAELRLPLTARPPDDDRTVEVEVGDAVLAQVPAHLEPDARNRAPDADAAVGRAMVDGAYAALRAAAAGGSLR